MKNKLKRDILKTKEEKMLSFSHITMHPTTYRELPIMLEIPSILQKLPRKVRQISLYSVACILWERVQSY